ncbi:MAG: flippase [Chloroflexota bacterium]
MGTAEKVARNSLFNLVNVGVSAPLSFAISIVLARGLGPEVYGTYAFYIWVISLCGYLVNLGLGSTATKYISEYLGRGEGEHARGIVWMVFKGRVRAALAVAAAALLLAIPLTHLIGKGHSPVYWIIVAGAVLPYTLFYLFQSISLGLQKFQYVAVQTLVSVPLRLGLALLVVYLGFAAVGQLAADIIVWALGVGVGIYLLNRSLPLRSLFRAPLAREAAARTRSYAMAMTGILLAEYLIWDRSEILLLGFLRPDQEVGFYTLGVKLPRLLMAVVPAVLGGVLFPTLSEQFGRKDMTKLKAVFTTSARYLMILALPLVAGGVALAAPLVNVLYGTAYAPAISIMMIAFLPASFLVFVTLCRQALYAVDKPAFALKVAVVLAPLHIGLNLLFISRYGAIGAAIATSALQFLILPVYIWLMYRETRALWPLADGARTVLAAAVMGIALFALYKVWGTIPALVLALPLGGALYFLGLVAFGALRAQDLEILAKAKEVLPSILWNPYRGMMRAMGSLMGPAASLRGWVVAGARKANSGYGKSRD